MQKFSLLLLLLVGLLYTACGDDDDGINNPSCTATVFSQEVNDAATAYSNAAAAFSTDPSTENCTNLRNAANAYLDKVEEFEDCTVINQTEYQTALDAARQSVNSITC